jgi:hypothetical protein
MQPKTGVDPSKKAPILPGAETPGNPSLGEHDVQKGLFDDITRSQLDQFSTPPLKRVGLNERTVEEQVSPEVCKQILVSLQNEFLKVQKTLKENAEKESTLLELEEKNSQKEKELKQIQEQNNAGVLGTLKGVKEAYKLDKMLPVGVALHLIQHSLPALNEAFEKAKTSKAKDEFAKACSSVIEFAMKNALLLGNKPDQESNIKTLKDSLLKQDIPNIFKEQASAELLKVISMTIEKAKIEPITVPQTSKDVWIARFLAAVNTAKYPTLYASVASAIYATAQAEVTLLSCAPELIYNFISAIQGYIGSPTVPLLLFAVGYLIYYMIQAGYAIKEGIRPTSEAAKKQIEEAEWAARCAHNAITA